MSKTALSHSCACKPRYGLTNYNASENLIFDREHPFKNSAWANTDVQTSVLRIFIYRDKGTRKNIITKCRKF